MATEYEPRIGDWYRTINGDNFEIVALDPDDSTLEIQYFDGTVEELDLETWYELDLESVEAPEDWSGSMDIQRDDYGVDLELGGADARSNPLDRLDGED
ncbi:MAG: DUF6763 family protein [Thiohalobacteraceae bacterium]